KGAEERREFDGERNGECLLESVYDLRDAVFDGGAALVGVADDGVDVQLERIRARLLNQLRKLQPRFSRDSVQRTDDRNRDRALQTTNLLQIFIRTMGVAPRLRKIRHDGSKAILERIHVVDPARLLRRDLLFKQRVQHDGGTAGVFEPA